MYTLVPLVIGLVISVVVACVVWALQRFLPTDRSAHWDGRVLNFFFGFREVWPRNTPAWGLVIILGLPIIAVALAYRVVLVAQHARQQLHLSLATMGMPTFFGAVLGAGIGFVLSWAMLLLGAKSGTAGAAALTSGLAASGSLIGGGMSAGLFVLAMPPIVFALAGQSIVRWSNLRRRRRTEETAGRLGGEC